jgi:hypothetical protein
MSLSLQQVAGLQEDGFCILPGIVSNDLVRIARAEINAELGRGFDPAEVPSMNAQSWCPELAPDQIITDLFYESPLFRLVCDTMKQPADGNVALGPISHVDRGQIALRFPASEYDEHPAAQVYEDHLDGLHSSTNNVPVGSVRSFTMLVGVALSDCLEDDCGNFVVHKGSHRRVEQVYAQQAQRAARGEGVGAGLGPGGGGSDGIWPPGTFYPPTAVDAGSSSGYQVKLRAGDAIITHSNVVHAAAKNGGPDIRYMVYFRVWHRDHALWNSRALLNNFMLWKGFEEENAWAADVPRSKI